MVVSKGAVVVEGGMGIQKELMVELGFCGLPHRRRINFGGAVGYHCYGYGCCGRDDREGVPDGFGTT